MELSARFPLVLQSVGMELDMGLKLVTITMDRAVRKAARLIEVIIVQERLGNHQLVLLNVETKSKQANNNVTMATKLDVPIVR